MPADPEQIEEHSRRSAENADAGPVGVPPDDRDLLDSEAEAIAEEEQLDVEGEVVDDHPLEQRACSLPVDQLEAALGVVVPQSRDRTEDAVERPAHQPAERTLFDLDLRTGETSRTEGHIEILVTCRLRELRMLLDRRGQVGVRDQHPATLRLENSTADGGSLAQILRVAQHASGRLPQVDRGHSCRVVGRSVVNDQDLGVEPAFAEVGVDQRQGRAEPVFLVVRGND